MKRRILFMALAAASQFYVQAGAAEVSRTSSVKFNTICARCHEGECSGRLSFSSGVSGAQSHVRRYIPSSSPLEVEELFTILKYTKENCTQYPLPDAIPADGVWDMNALRQWRSPDSESYFIPLGRMYRGTYRLSLRFEGKAEASVRISDENFDVLLEEQQYTDQTFERTFPVATETLYYLHLKSGTTLLELILTPVR